MRKADWSPSLVYFLLCVEIDWYPVSHHTLSYPCCSFPRFIPCLPEYACCSLLLLAGHSWGAFHALISAVKILSNSIGFSVLPSLTFSGEHAPKLASRIQHVAPSTWKPSCWLQLQRGPAPHLQSPHPEWWTQVGASKSPFEHLGCILRNCYRNCCCRLLSLG